MRLSTDFNPVTLPEPPKLPVANQLNKETIGTSLSWDLTIESMLSTGFEKYHSLSNLQVANVLQRYGREIFDNDLYM